MLPKRGRALLCRRSGGDAYTAAVTENAADFPDSSPASPPAPWLASYAPGVPERITEPARSLVEIIRDSAAEYPDSVALEFFGAETRYADLVDQIERAAEGLRRAGVAAGDRVGLILPNCPQHIVAFYAILRLGAVVVEHNPLYTPEELKHQFEDHGARVVVSWTKTVATVQSFAAELGIREIIAVDLIDAVPAMMRVALRLPIPKLRAARAQLRSDVSGVTSWRELLSHGPVGAAVPLPGVSDVAVIQYTSGTTGRPKGAVLSHANLLANADQARAWVPTITRGDGVVHAVLPMFHAYGLTLCVTFAMNMAARLVLFPSFDPDRVLASIKRRPPTFFPAVPPIAERLLRRAQETGTSLAGMEIAISGAMALSEDLVKPWEEATGGYLVEGYGLSEASPVLMANPVSESRKAGTVGLPLPSTEVRIADPEAPERVLPIGEAGELQARGPQIFSEYLGRPEESAAMFSADGWLRTGDIAVIDEDGFVSIVDRIKELIITGGFNVAPTEVEEALRLHPAIRDAAVVGVPDAHSGESVVAAIVLEDGQTLPDTETLRTFAKQHLTAYKVPRRFVTIDALPVSMIGKVLRREVRDLVREAPSS